MKIISALSRYKASRGFGVHSPFAYKFILDVLDEKYEYYSYERLQQLRQEVIERTRNLQGYTPRVIPIGEAATLFRVANYFKPSQFLSIGSSYGVGVASVLMVSSRSSAIVYDPKLNDNTAASDVFALYSDRARLIDDMACAIDTYTENADNGLFLVINTLPESDLETVKRGVAEMITRQGVIVIRNIDKSRTQEAIWKQCLDDMTFGMTFTNGKMAVIVLNPKLPRQDFDVMFT